MVHTKILRRTPTTGMASLVLLLALTACSDGSDTPPMAQKPQAANPVVDGPISGGGGADCCIINFGALAVDLREQGYTPGTPFYAGLTFDEAEVGYRESEYFISGTATSYICLLYTSDAADE